MWFIQINTYISYVIRFDCGIKFLTWNSGELFSVYQRAELPDELTSFIVHGIEATNSVHKKFNRQILTLLTLNTRTKSMHNA